MAGAYKSNWMSLEEALEYLDFITEDRRERFKQLQAAVCDGKIVVRARGMEIDRSYYWNAHISNDPDYAEQVDGRLRREFLSCDPSLIDLDRCGDAVEFLRAEVVGLFGGPPRTEASTVPKVSERAIKEFCKDYIERECAAGRRPTQMGCEHVARDEGFRPSRGQLRATFQELFQSKTGDDVRRGRPLKPQA
jgi:hypothetical protein